MKPHLSSHVEAGSLIFLSGQLPFDRKGEIVAGDLAAQTTQALENLEGVLRELGLARSNIVKATIWLRAGGDFAAFNAAYAAFFGEHRPARSTVYSDLLVPSANVEIEAVAFKA